MRLNIAPHLARAKMTQSTLAEMVDVKKGFMSEVISGKKSPSVETLVAIAQALAVPVGALFDQGSTAPTLPAGFSDHDATPFMHSGRPDGGPPSDLSFLTTGLRRAETYVVERSIPWLSLLPGDLLIVDLGTPAQTGDVALIGVTDFATHETKTMIARLHGSFALIPDPTAQVNPFCPLTIPAEPFGAQPCVVLFGAPYPDFGCGQVWQP